MKFLVILSCLLASTLAQYHAKPQYPQHIPVIGHNGVPVEPPAVIKARNEHLAALKAASAHSPSQGYAQHNNYDDSHKYDNGDYKPELYENQQSYSGYSQPQAAPAYNKYQAPITSAPAHYSHTPSSYAGTSFGPSHFGGAFAAHSAYSEPKIGHNGVPLDTPEVAAAKAAHFEAHSRAAGAAHNQYRYRRDIHGHATSSQNHNAHFGPHQVISVGHHEHYSPEHSEFEQYSVGESHGLYRKRREAYGHATSYQNHNAHFGPHHEVPVYGHHHAAPLSHHELPHDTPEVEYAKHKHFAAHAALGHYIHRRDVYGHATSSQNHNAYFGHHHIVPVSGGHHYDHHGYNGHLHVPHDTPEVAAAKAEHFAAHAQATHGAHYGLTHGGVPHDTPEVAAAKHQHFAAHAAARGHYY